jgi:hypothetical protein
MKPWKAPISDTKALKITRKCLFYKAFTVRDAEAASSSLVASTTKKKHPMGAFSLYLQMLSSEFVAPAPRCGAKSARVWDGGRKF